MQATYIPGALVNAACAESMFLSRVCLPGAEGRLNQNMFAGPHGSPVTESNLQVIEELAEKLSELAVHHEELKAQV